MSTIAALATPPGAGGVGIVRISGPAAVEIVRSLVGVADLPDRRFVHGWARDAGGERLDEVMVVVMRGPRSYTGEDVAEVHGHGGVANMARLLRAVLAQGARMAEPGEFTRRAFEHRRLDLTQAEAVADVIAAASERALRAAQAHLSGALGKDVGAVRQTVIALLAEVEASIDFPEEDLDFVAPGEVAARARAAAAWARRLAATHAVGRALRDGIEVALVGAPNVGKSSLLNALAGEERALVSAEPGTTRDWVEARVEWDGIPVILIDTAGDREASGVEARGVELGRARARRASVIVRVRAPDVAETGADAYERALEVWNKADLGGVGSGLAVSAVTGEGLGALRRAVLERVLGEAGEGSEGLVISSARHATLLTDAAAALEGAAGAAAEARPAELVALDLRAAATALGRITGEDVDEDMLDALFAQFCIGK